MSNNVNEKASAVYSTMCSYFERSGYVYKRDDANLTISCEGKGKDVPMLAFVTVYPENELICCTTVIPAEFSRFDHCVAAAAVNIANSRIIDGIFEYDMSYRRIGYRISCSFTDREIPESIIGYLVNCAFQTVDAFNDKLAELSDEKIDLEEFARFVEGL